MPKRKTIPRKKSPQHQDSLRILRALLQVLEAGQQIPEFCFDHVEEIFINQRFITDFVAILQEVIQYNTRIVLSFGDIFYTIPFLLRSPELRALIAGMLIIADQSSLADAQRALQEQQQFFETYKVVLLVNPLEYYVLRDLPEFHTMIVINEAQYRDEATQHFTIWSALPAYREFMREIVTKMREDTDNSHAITEYCKFLRESRSRTQDFVSQYG